MKKSIIFLSLVISFFMVGCNNTRLKYEKEIKLLSNTAIEDVELLSAISKDDAEEAFEYIKMNIYRFSEDRPTAKKIIYYSTYLEKLGNKSSLGQVHPITDFAVQVNCIVTKWYLGDIKTKALESSNEFEFIGVYISSFLPSTLDEFISILK